ncbi:MAG: hypothetical protein AB7F32_01910 [Victivallaceae bacterium]
MKLRRLSIFALCVLGWTASAEVYWLGPKVSGGGADVPGAAFDSLLEMKRAIQEPVIFNGIDTEMRVYVINTPLDELVRELKIRYPKLVIENLGGNLRMSWPVGRNYREQVLLTGGGRLGNVTAFAMQMPVKRISPIPVPENVPVPPGAAVTESLVMKKSGVATVAFDLPEGAGRLEDVKHELVGAGYIAVDDGIFMREKPKKEMIQLQKSENGGIIIRTPLP